MVQFKVCRNLFDCLIVLLHCSFGTTRARIKVQELQQKTARFIAIGDWGSPVTSGEEKQVADQRAVAETMSSWCDSRRCDFIISLGDNFYPDGVASKNDERFTKSWRSIYNQTSIASLRW